MSDEGGLKTGNEEEFLADVFKKDDRPPEKLTEDERLKRFLGRRYTLEAVMPMPDGKPAWVGRCPGYYDDFEACRIQAREMMADGRDITHVRILDTRSWKILAVEKR